LDFSHSQQRKTIKEENIPHVKNVDLVPEAQSHGRAPGFNFHFNFVLIIGLSVGFAVSTCCGGQSAASG